MKMDGLQRRLGFKRTFQLNPKDRSVSIFRTVQLTRSRTVYVLILGLSTFERHMIPRYYLIYLFLVFAVMQLPVPQMHFLSSADTNIQVRLTSYLIFSKHLLFQKLQFQQWLVFDMTLGSKWVTYWIHDIIIQLSWSGMKFLLLVERVPSKSRNIWVA